MKDTNICENCNHYLPLDCDVCLHCEQSMFLDSTGMLCLWRLGDIRDGILGHIAHNPPTLMNDHRIGLLGKVSLQLFSWSKSTTGTVRALL